MTTETEQKKPGTTLMNAGLGIAAVSAVLIVVVLAAGGNLTLFTVSAVLVGLVLAGIGYARRVLYAVENR